MLSKGVGGGEGLSFQIEKIQIPSTKEVAFERKEDVRKEGSENEQKISSTECVVVMTTSNGTKTMRSHLKALVLCGDDVDRTTSSEVASGTNLFSFSKDDAETRTKTTRRRRKSKRDVPTSGRSRRRRDLVLSPRSRKKSGPDRAARMSVFARPDELIRIPFEDDGTVRMLVYTIMERYKRLVEMQIQTSGTKAKREGWREGAYKTAISSSSSSSFSSLSPSSSSPLSNLLRPRSSSVSPKFLRDGGSKHRESVVNAFLRQLPDARAENARTHRLSVKWGMFVGNSEGRIDPSFPKVGRDSKVVDVIGHHATFVLKWRANESVFRFPDVERDRKCREGAPADRAVVDERDEDMLSRPLTRNARSSDSPEKYRALAFEFPMEIEMSSNVAHVAVVSWGQLRKTLMSLNRNALKRHNSSDDALTQVRLSQQRHDKHRTHAQTRRSHVIPKMSPPYRKSGVGSADGTGRARMPYNRTF